MSRGLKTCKCKWWGWGWSTIQNDKDLNGMPAHLGCQICFKTCNDWYNALQWRWRWGWGWWSTRWGRWSCNLCVGILGADKLTGGAFLQILGHSFWELHKETSPWLPAVSVIAVYVFNANSCLWAARFCRKHIYAIFLAATWSHGAFVTSVSTGEGAGCHILS